MLFVFMFLFVPDAFPSEEVVSIPKCNLIFFSTSVLNSHLTHMCNKWGRISCPLTDRVLKELSSINSLFVCNFIQVQMSVKIHCTHAKKQNKKREREHHM